MINIKLERVNDQLCANLHGRSYSIVEESRGVREKFWMKRTGKHLYYESPIHSRILFKFNRNDVSCEDWGEIYFSKLCNNMGIPCVTYTLAQAYDENDNFLGNGVMCGSYKRSVSESEFSVYDLQMGNDGTHLNCNADKINTVDGIIEGVRNNFDNLLENDIVTLRNELIIQAIMDFLCCQSDRHWLNTTILVYGSPQKTYIRKAPCYDNGCIAMLKRKQSAIEGMSKEIGKKGKDSEFLAAQLSKFCPMFGIKTSLVELKPEKNGFNRNERVKIKSPKASREIFLDEIADEILTNPPIAIFFSDLRRLIEKQGIDGLGFQKIHNGLEAEGNPPPECIEKMIRDVFGHQFDVLLERVNSRLKMYKVQENVR